MSIGSDQNLAAVRPNRAWRLIWRAAVICLTPTLSGWQDLFSASLFWVWCCFPWTWLKPYRSLAAAWQLSIVPRLLRFTPRFDAPALECEEKAHPQARGRL